MMNRLPFGIGDFLAELREAQTTVKGDTPGHEFHGNQYSAGGGSSEGGESGSSSSNARAEFEKNPAIVKRAITHGVTDIGQLSADDKKHLESHVKKGTLIKTQDYTYPKAKPRYQPSIDYMKSLGIQG